MILIIKHLRDHWRKYITMIIIVVLLLFIISYFNKNHQSTRSKEEIKLLKQEIKELLEINKMQKNGLALRDRIIDEYITAKNNNLDLMKKYKKEIEKELENDSKNAKKNSDIVDHIDRILSKYPKRRE